MKQHILPRLAFLIIALSVIGCRDHGPPRGSAEGIVTFQTKPVQNGFIIFENTAKGWTRSVKLDGGSYRMEQLPVMEFVVRVVPPEPKLPDENSRGRNPSEFRPIPDPKDIPTRVRNSESSPLRANVVEGKNHFDFELSR